MCRTSLRELDRQLWSLGLVHGYFPKAGRPVQGQAGVVCVVRLRNDAVVEAKRCPAAAVFAHRKPRRSLIGHVETAAIPVRRDEDEIVSGWIDRRSKVGGDAHVSNAAGQLRLS